MKDNANSPSWPDDEAWLVFLEPAFEADPETAGSAANMWDYLLDQLGKGRAGRRRVKDALEQLLSLTYPYTPEYKKAFEHWRLSLQGDMAADDEPMQLLSAAIERTKAGAARSRGPKKTSKAKPKRRASRRK
jgi:hypothetical protein